MGVSEKLDKNDDWKDDVLSIMRGQDENDNIKVKQLRKMVLLSRQQESDKATKKEFKRTIQTLEKEGVIQLDADGQVTLLEKKNKKRKGDKKESKKKKKKKDPVEPSNDPDEDPENDVVAPTEDESKETKGSNNKPCKGNPSGVTRLFVGNLPFAVDEHSLEAFLGSEGNNGASITHIKWITDQATGKFYGSAFVEMKDSQTAAEAVSKAGSSLMGRPIKVRHREYLAVLP